MMVSIECPPAPHVRSWKFRCDFAVSHCIFTRLSWLKWPLDRGTESLILHVARTIPSSQSLSDQESSILRKEHLEPSETFDSKWNSAEWQCPRASRVCIPRSWGCRTIDSHWDIQTSRVTCMYVWSAQYFTLPNTWISGHRMPWPHDWFTDRAPPSRSTRKQRSRE